MKSDLLVRLKSEGHQVTPERKNNSLKTETWLLTVDFIRFIMIFLIRVVHFEAQYLKSALQMSDSVSD